MDKSTGQSRGLAFVKYAKQSQAARALEECDTCEFVITTGKSGLPKVFHFTLVEILVGVVPVYLWQLNAS